MPMYAFRNGRTVVERSFRVSERPDSIEIGGKTFRRSFADERPGVPSSAGWPLECVASGVHPSQADSLRKYFSDHGCPTEVTADGNPVYRNASHRRKALKLRGFKDRSGYFG